MKQSGKPCGPRFRTSCRAAARLCLSASIAFALAGCAPSTGDEMDVDLDNASGMSIWTDSSTGCKYIIYATNRFSSMAMGGMTVRYKSDGTPDCPRDTDGNPQGENAKQVSGDSLTAGAEGIAQGGPND